MGFFQDLRQDLSQTVNDSAAGTEDLGDLFEESENTDFADLDAELEKEVAALKAAPTDLEGLQDNFRQAATQNPTNENFAVESEQAADTIDISTVQENDISEADAEMEELLNEVEQNLQESVYMDAAPEVKQETDFDTSAAASTDTAVITSGMSITGDVTSSGNMDLIGSITGNIEILGKLNVTGSITGNSAAAEIYAESAQINGEVRSNGSVKIGQSSVVIGNIFATSAVIAGAVKGDIDVHGPVILDTSAIVMGNIKSKSVQINNGAVIEGMCSQCYADVSPSAFFNDMKKNRKQVE